MCIRDSIKLIPIFLHFIFLANQVIYFTTQQPQRTLTVETVAVQNNEKAPHCRRQTLTLYQVLLNWPVQSPCYPSHPLVIKNMVFRHHFNRPRPPSFHWLVAQKDLPWRHAPRAKEVSIETHQFVRSAKQKVIPRIQRKEKCLNKNEWFITDEISTIF